MEDYKNQWTHALLAYAAQRGIAPQQVCDLSGIVLADLQKKKYTLTSEQVNSLWKNAVQLSHDHQFGLHFGESMQLTALGLIGQIIITSNTVGEALSHAGRMIHLVTDMFQIQVSTHASTFSIEFVPDKDKSRRYPYTFRQMADYLLVFVLHELNGVLLERLQPEAVNVSYPLGDAHEYERIFRCPVLSDSDRLSLELSMHILSLPIITANYEIQKMLLQKTDTLLRHTPIDQTFQTKIYYYLLTNSYLSTMSLEAVAANFNMSTRSLQRRLKEEGVTFLEIVEEVRKNLAIHYLTSEQLQIKDIAYTLGYNEPSAFLRAFKRWTGKTPTSYKNL